MSTPGRPKGEYRSAQREGNPVSAAGASRGAQRAAPRDWSDTDTLPPPRLYGPRR